MHEGVQAERCAYYRPVAIIGPTASGKTAAAFELAQRLGAEIISADSMAVYRGLDIGTAKPTPEEQQRVRFHMIDVVDPDEPYTVADFQEQAAEIVDDLIGRCTIPLIVGGTGLYLRGLIDGLNIPGPGPDQGIRDRLQKIAKDQSPMILHQMLAEVDPASAARLHPNDVKRVVRALEVHEQTGIPMSVAVEETKPAAARYPDAMLFGLTMDRAALYRRIEERIDQQISDGLVAEVAGLLERGYDPKLPALQGLGYKEIIGHLQGQYNLENAVYLLKRNTRRFAKRQLTWFRADERIAWIDVDELSADQVADIIEAKLGEAMAI